MNRLYFITPHLKGHYDQISFFAKGSFWYNYHLNHSLSLKNQAFIYEINIDENNITSDMRDKKDNKILKITEENKKFFSPYNYKNSYFHNKQYYFPYPFYQLCHSVIFNNFVGIDATQYEKENVHENFTLEGMIWQPKKINFKLELKDYITSLPN